MCGIKSIVCNRLMAWLMQNICGYSVTGPSDVLSRASRDVGCPLADKKRDDCGVANKQMRGHTVIRSLRIGGLGG